MLKATMEYDVWLELTEEDAQACSHSGTCDEDVLYTSKLEYVKKQTDQWPVTALADALAEYTDWDVSDHGQNIQRGIWILAGDMIDENN